MAPLLPSVCSLKTSFNSTFGSSKDEIRPVQFNGSRAIKILASSVSKTNNTIQLLSRPLLDDRKGVLDHLLPRPLLTSTARVFTVQASMIFSNYIKDQTEEETKLEEMVTYGTMTDTEAEERCEEWEQREWNLRWQSYPEKVALGLAKYHAITLVMRFYEFIADKIFKDDVILDKLTIDCFKGSKRMALVSDSKSTLARGMFTQCLWSNMISFLADYTVHQAVLCYIYYLYWSRKRNEKKIGKQDGTNGTSDYALLDAQDMPDDEDSIIFALAQKSGSLALYRSLGLIVCSAGGAVGSVVYPGWGTLLCSQMGDALLEGVVVQ